MKMRKIIKTILAVLAVIIIAVAAIAACAARVVDPNKLLKKYAPEIVAGEEYGADFQWKPDYMGESACMTALRFTPDESAEYTFTASCTEDKKVEIDMYVLDESLSELLAADNYGSDEMSDAVSDIAEGTVFLTSGRLYYVVVEGYSEDEKALDSFKGSFRFSVNKAGDGAPAEVKAGESVTLKLNRDQQACAMFVPEETAFYDFDTGIVSRDASAGFSSIYDITSEDQTSLVVTDGICYMEAGKTYYIWVAVDETTKKSSEVELSCSRMESETASGICSIEVSGKTVIEYTADANVPLMISSSSDGDPDVVMYDSDGFMLRKDDDSGGPVSGNPQDFALGFNAEKRKVYRICVDGEFTQCTVIIQVYRGDGSAPDAGATAESEETEGAGEAAGSKTEAAEDAGE